MYNIQSRGASLAETSGHTRYQINTVKYTWKIDNFSLCPQRPGKKIVSPIFPVNDKISCSLRAYPKGILQDYKKYISFYVWLNKCERGVRARLKLSVIDVKKEEILFVRTKIKKWDIKIYKHYAWGSAIFLKRDALLNKNTGYLPDDTLTIICEIDVISTEEFSTLGQSSLSQAQAQRLLVSMGNLLASQRFSDVTLIAKGREFRAHKAILSARSSVFEAMFRFETEDDEDNRVDISHIESSVIEEILLYMYTGKSPRLAEGIQLNEQFVIDLRQTAELYQLDEIVSMCEAVIDKNSSTRSALRSPGDSKLLASTSSAGAQVKQSEQTFEAPCPEKIKPI